MTDERRTYLIRVAALNAAVNAYPGNSPDHIVQGAKVFERYLTVEEKVSA